MVGKALNKNVLISLLTLPHDTITSSRWSSPDSIPTPIATPPRVRMRADYDSENWSVSELCRRYGICRDTFYDWRRRRASGAADWFTDRSHAPLHCPHETDAALKDAIIAMRRR